MGNCINNNCSSLETIVTKDNDKPRNEVSDPCDEQTERTTESSSNGTNSSPQSPLAIAAGLTGMEKDEPNIHVPPQHMSTPPRTSRKSPPKVIGGGHEEMEQDEPVSPLSHHTSSPSPTKVSGDPSSMEDEREDGQKRLRELVVSGAISGKIDWKSIISLAEDLHQREQDLLRSYAKPNCGSGRKLPRKNISRRQAFFEKRQRKKEIVRRRKLESVGSFSVNLLMYDADDLHCKKRGTLESIAESINESGSSSQSQDAPNDSQKIDVYEDDDPSPLNDDTSCSTISTFVSQVQLETERPGTTSPFVETRTADVQVSFATEGSFMAATSLFNFPAEDECSSNSSDGSDGSTSDVSPENWDLMTIAEDATVTD